MRVDVEVRGDREASELVSRLARRMEDGRPALRGLVDLILEAEQERFAGRGQRWKRLAASTLRRKKGRGRPLVLTGELMRSLTVRGAPEQLVTITPRSLRFGTRVYYARFHQKGRGVPRRTVVGVTRVQKQSLVAELRRVLLEDPS